MTTRLVHPAWLAIAAALLAAAVMLAMGGSTVSAQQAPQAPVDACSGVPDSGPSFDFTQACLAHDACYATHGGVPRTPQSEAARTQCDFAFVNDMKAWCTEALATKQITLAQVASCRSTANLYWAGVRLLGGFFFFNAKQPV